MRSTKHSRTATLVAGGVVLASSEPGLQGVVPTEAVVLTRTLLGVTTGGRRLLRCIDSRSGRTALHLLERWTIPGIVGHWNCRKRWIEDAWRQARGEGFDTLVVAGSGFDTLSLRVARSGDEHVRTIDIDHPQTLKARRTGLAKIGGSSPILVEHDLSEPGLKRALEGALPAEASTFLVIEGVLMYLDPARVVALLAEVGTLPSKRLRLVITFMELSSAGVPAFRPRSRLVDAWLSLVGEPFRSGMAAESAREVLAMQGFLPREVARHPGHSLANAELPSGECAVIADHVRSHSGAQAV